METMTEAVIIKCKECGCIRGIKPKEIPEGDCDYCRKDFGFYFFPGQFLNADETLNNDNVLVDSLVPGDIVTINTKLKPEDVKRIYSIERNGKIIYQNGELKP